MLLPLFYYLVAFFIYVFLYEYYRNNARKNIAKLDFLQNLETVPFNSIPTSNKKSFDQIKKEINTYFYFNRIRVIFGIDLSASNEWQGRKTFNGYSLHKTQANTIYNPYQKAISQLGVIFEDIFSSKIEYSCFGFGDSEAKDGTYFPIVGTGDEFNNYRRVLDAYLEQTKNVVLGGPTAFIPIIKQLMIYGIHCRNDFTMLVILTDELKMSHDDNSFVESIRNLTNLSNVCLIVVGVGDGPWQRISYEEHCLRELVFKKDKKKTKKSEVEISQSKVCYDNFHFVDFNSSNIKPDKNDNENYFARAILTKLPTQLKQASRNNQNQTRL